MKGVLYLMGLTHIKCKINEDFTIRIKEHNDEIFILWDDVCENLLIKQKEYIWDVADYKNILKYSSRVFINMCGLEQVYSHYNGLIPSKFDIFLKTEVFKPYKWEDYKIYRFFTQNGNLLRFAYSKTDFYVHLDDLYKIIQLNENNITKYSNYAEKELEKKIRIKWGISEEVKNGLPLHSTIWLLNIIPETECIESLLYWIDNFITPYFTINLSKPNSLSLELQHIFDFDYITAYKLSCNQKFAKFFNNIKCIFDIDK